MESPDDRVLAAVGGYSEIVDSSSPQTKIPEPLDASSTVRDLLRKHHALQQIRRELVPVLAEFGDGHGEHVQSSGLMFRFKTMGIKQQLLTRENPIVNGYLVDAMLYGETR